MVIMKDTVAVSVKGDTHSQLNRAILLRDVIPDGKTQKLRSFEGNNVLSVILVPSQIKNMLGGEVGKITWEEYSKI